MNMNCFTVIPSCLLIQSNLILPADLFFLSSLSSLFGSCLSSFLFFSFLPHSLSSSGSGDGRLNWLLSDRSPAVLGSLLSFRFSFLSLSSQAGVALTSAYSVIIQLSLTEQFMLKQKWYTRRITSSIWGKHLLSLYELLN